MEPLRTEAMPPVPEQPGTEAMPPRAETGSCPTVMIGMIGEVGSEDRPAAERQYVLECTNCGDVVADDTSLEPPSLEEEDWRARCPKCGNVVKNFTRLDYFVAHHDEITAYRRERESSTSHATTDTPTATARSTPVGKVKVSFNLQPSDVDALRALANRLGTTVTNVVQRAIRDEVFLQESIDAGNRIAIVDQAGGSREIIWR